MSDITQYQEDFDYDPLTSTSEGGTQTSSNNTLESGPASIVARTEDVGTEEALPNVDSLNQSDPDSDSSEKPPKLQKLEEKTKEHPDAAESEDFCSICFDQFAQCGDHRLASLKCGHIFGYKCILRWLQIQDSKICPSCKTKASSRDIRFIYAKKLIAVDNSELEAMTAKYIEAQTNYVSAKLELDKCRFVQSTMAREIAELQALNAGLRSATESVQQTLKKLSWRFSVEKNIEVCSEGTCRVLAHDLTRSMLYISKHYRNTMFAGYGISKLHCETYTSSNLINIHPKPIRDMAYSAATDYLLTVSLDKNAKMLSMSNGRVVLTFPCEIPLWSCCWDSACDDRFFVGGPGGVVLQYDVRQPRTCLSRVTNESDVSPVISVASTESGLLSCHLNSCWMHQRDLSKAERVPVEGPFVSLTYERLSDNVLVSSRPSQLCTRSRHTICKFQTSEDDKIRCVPEQVFQGSTVQTHMSRSCQMSLGTDVLVAAHDEAASSLSVWSTDSYKMIQSLPSRDHTLDTSAIAGSGCDSQFLVTLSGNRVRIYRAIMLT